MRNPGINQLVVLHSSQIETSIAGRLALAEQVYCLVQRDCILRKRGYWKSWLAGANPPTVARFAGGEPGLAMRRISGHSLAVL
jgi:hypothetical protein